MTLTPSCLQVLSEALTLWPNQVKINRELPPEVFEEVHGVLTHLGGRYQAGARRYIFSTDPKPLIDHTIQTKTRPHKHDLNHHPTPHEVVDVMLELLQGHFSSDESPIQALEPSAGRGRIADRLRSMGHQVTCVELNPLHAAVLRHNGHRVLQEDFLQVRDAGPFDVVLMNPPFNLPERPETYIDHVMHAHQMLDEHGLLVAVVPLGFLKRTTRRHQNFRLFLRKHEVEHVHLQAGAFRASGTDVETVALLLQKKPLPRNPVCGFASWEACSVALTVLNDQKLRKSAQDWMQNQPPRLTSSQGLGDFLHEVALNINLHEPQVFVFLNDLDVQDLQGHFMRVFQHKPASVLAQNEPPPLPSHPPHTEQTERFTGEDPFVWMDSWG